MNVTSFMKRVGQLYCIVQKYDSVYRKGIQIGCRSVTRFFKLRGCFGLNFFKRGWLWLKLIALHRPLYKVSFGDQGGWHSDNRCLRSPLFPHSFWLHLNLMPLKGLLVSVLPMSCITAISNWYGCNNKFFIIYLLLSEL